MQRRTVERKGITTGGSWWAFACVLAMSSIVMLIYARSALFTIDETLTCFAVLRANAAAVLRFQLHTPIILEPPAFDLLIHGWSWLTGSETATVLRLPSVAGILLFQITVFLAARRLAGSRSAVLASMVVLGSPVIEFGAQVRPYALLAGVMAWALLCWLELAMGHSRRRWLWALLLFVSLTFAINSHYFAVFSVVPFVAAEVVRTWEKRGLDLPVAAALAGACASIVLTLPFQRAIAEWRAHTIIGGDHWQPVVMTYLAVLPSWKLLQPLLFAAMLAVAGFAARALWRQFGRAVAVLMAGMALLPVLGGLYAGFVLHAFSARYMMYFLAAWLICLSVVAEPWLRRLQPRVVAVIFIMAMLGLARHQMRLLGQVKSDAARQLTEMEPSPALRGAMAADPELPVYVPVESCMMESRYPHPALRPHLRCVVSRWRQIAMGDHSDTVFLTARVLNGTAPFHIADFDEVVAAGHPQWLVFRSEAWESWIPEALRREGWTWIPEGRGVSGDVVLAFPPGNSR